MEGEPLRVPRLGHVLPVQHRAVPRALRLGVWDALSRGGLREFAEAGELPPPPLGDQCSQIPAEIREEQEGLGRAPFFAHEEQRQRRSEEDDGGGGAYRLGRGELGDALAEGAVADLVVVLEEVHEARGRQLGARLPPLAPPVGGPLALIREALGEAAGEVAQGGMVVLVVATLLAGEEDVERVVDVVVPLSQVGRALVGAAPCQASRLVAVVLEDEMYEAVPAGAFGHRAGQLVEHVVGRAVGHGMHGVQPQPVEMKLLQPVQRVVDDEGADHLAIRAVEVEGVAPRCLVLAGEKGGGVAMEIVPLGTEVVVHHVEEYGEAAGVAGLDERLQLPRPSVGRMGSEGQHAVVAPSPASGEVGNGHQLHRGHPEGDQVVEPLRQPREGALGAEGADVQLVEDEPLGRDAAPLAVGPGVLERIDDLARAVHIQGLIARSGVRHEQLGVDAKGVPRSRGRIARHPLRPARRVLRHGEPLSPIGEPELDLLRGGRPEPEACGAVVTRLRTEGHAMCSSPRRLPAHRFARGRRSRRRASDRASSGYVSPARKAGRRGPRSQSRVSRSSSQRTRALWAGTMKGTASWWALRRRRKVSPTIGWPPQSISLMASPASRRPRQRVKPLCHSSSVISLPSGLNQERSLTAEPWMRRPWKKRRRWNTGLSRRSRMRRRVKSSWRPAERARGQWCQDSSLSWQYALLLPCWVRMASSPARSMGMPWERRRVARKLRIWRSRRAFTTGSSMGPSAPQFHEALSSVPSRLSSPLASLCFPL